jgi:hypothetical protein
MSQEVLACDLRPGDIIHWKPFEEDRIVVAIGNAPGRLFRDTTIAVDDGDSGRFSFDHKFMRREQIDVPAIDINIPALLSLALGLTERVRALEEQNERLWDLVNRL